MNFEAAWKRRYSDCPPLAHAMRYAEVQHWVRFHSLPDSKRYPDSQAEQDGLLARHNVLAGEVLGQDQPCWMAQTCWHSTEGMIDLADDPFWPSREYGLTRSFEFLEEDDEEMRWSVNAAPFSWLTGAFDKVLLAIAEEAVHYVFWMSAGGAVFAPYDGGVDLFLPDRAAAQALKVKHSNWLSPRPDGL